MKESWFVGRVVGADCSWWKKKHPGFHDEDDGDADDDDAWLWREGKTKVGTEATRLRETSGSHSLVRSSALVAFDDFAGLGGTALQSTAHLPWRHLLWHALSFLFLRWLFLLLISFLVLFWTNDIVSGTTPIFPHCLAPLRLVASEAQFPEHFVAPTEDLLAVKISALIFPSTAAKQQVWNHAVHLRLTIEFNWLRNVDKYVEILWKYCKDMQRQWLITIRGGSILAPKTVSSNPNTHHLERNIVRCSTSYVTM